MNAALWSAALVALICLRCLQLRSVWKEKQAQNKREVAYQSGPQFVLRSA